MKISIIFHSETGHTKEMASIIANGIKSEGDITVKEMHVDQLDHKFINESQAILFGTPIYSSSMSWKMKQFFDTAPLNMKDKLGAVFSTSDHVGGGDSIGELMMIAAMLVRSMVVYSGGVFEGQPHTHLGATAIKCGDDGQKNRAEIFGQRIAKKTLELFN